MLLSNSIKILLLLLGGVFIVLQGLGFEFEGASVSTLMLLLLAILYYAWTKKKSNLFLLFLISFALAQIIGFSSYYVPDSFIEDVDYFYYISNSLYIIAYLFLIARITSGLSFKHILSQFYVPIVILFILDIFCVILVTDTTQNVLTLNEYLLEFFYNGVIMVLLSVALINYMYRNDNKSMLFLLGSIFIVFSEIIQLAYFYIIDDNYLGFIYSSFLVAAFFFLYIQSQKSYSGPVPIYSDEKQSDTKSEF